VPSMSNRALFTFYRKSRPLLTQGLMGRRKLVDSEVNRELQHPEGPLYKLTWALREFC